MNISKNFFIIVTLALPFSLCAAAEKSAAPSDAEQSEKTIFAHFQKMLKLGKTTIEDAPYVTSACGGAPIQPDTAIKRPPTYITKTGYQLPMYIDFSKISPPVSCIVRIPYHYDDPSVALLEDAQEIWGSPIPDSPPTEFFNSDLLRAYRTVNRGYIETVLYLKSFKGASILRPLLVAPSPKKGEWQYVAPLMMRSELILQLHAIQEELRKIDRLKKNNNLPS